MDSVTIHSALGDTLSHMVTEISSMQNNFSLWDKGQFMVLLSSTKFAKNTIFVGNKTDTVNTLLNILMKKKLHGQNIWN